jgi:hypothetical protein
MRWQMNVVKALDQLSREHPVARFIDPSEVLLLVASSTLVVGAAYLFELVINGLLPTLWGS